MIHIYYYYSYLTRRVGPRLVDRRRSSDRTRREASSVIWWSAPVKETRSDSSDQVTVVMINLLYTPFHSFIFTFNKLIQAIDTRKHKYSVRLSFGVHVYVCDVVDVFHKKLCVVELCCHQFQRVVIRSQKTTVWWSTKSDHTLRNLQYQNKEHWWVYSKESDWFKLFLGGGIGLQ
jgi:hypothetical protein